MTNGHEWFNLDVYYCGSSRFRTGERECTYLPMPVSQLIVTPTRPHITGNLLKCTYFTETACQIAVVLLQYL